jgi:hypothetical protein
MPKPFESSGHNGAPANPPAYYIPISILKNPEGMIQFFLPPDWRRQGPVWVHYDVNGVDVSRTKKENYTLRYVDKKTGRVMHSSILPPIKEIKGRTRFLDRSEQDIRIHFDED